MLIRMVSLTLALALLVTLILACGFTQREAVKAAPVARAQASQGRGLYRHHSAGYWAWRYRVASTRYRSAKATLLHRASVSEALNLACTVYGNCATLWALARCETGGTFNPHSANRHSSARGLLQFLTAPNGGTWAKTPFRGFSVYSAYANALAGGWMLSHGRRGEWVC